MAFKDYRTIFTALEEQGWTKLPSTNGHFKMVPPDKTKEIVCVATSSSDPRSLKNTLRDLRASGFVWPWRPPSKRHNTEPEDLMVAENQQHYEVPVEPRNTVDDLFARLKDARSYAALAKEARDAAQAEMRRVEAELAGSEKEFEMAVEQLRKCKADFDSAFEEVT